MQMKNAENVRKNREDPQNPHTLTSGGRNTLVYRRNGRLSSFIYLLLILYFLSS
jgi:5-methylcytosine-specific restriction endonuclease McrBC GTP-binding regulatory subunit McrB